MDRLLVDLLNYARLGSSDGHESEIDLNQLVENSFELLNGAEHFDLQIPKSLPTFNTLKVPLELVFRNLMNNAMKHHDRERGTVRVTFDDESPDFYTIYVSDDGPGIEERDRERAFEIFRQLKHGDRAKGSGMGLAMIRKTVQNYGGKIKIIDPKLSRGTTFQFTWPKVIPEDD